MYVGMTRPRDFLITTAMSGQNKFPWMSVLNKHDNWDFKTAAAADTGIVDIFDRGVNFSVQKLTLDNDVIHHTESNYYFKGKELNSTRNTTPYFVSPSKIEFKGNVKVNLFADVQNRIPTRISAKDKEDILGNCLHDILYLHFGNRLTNNTQDSLLSISSIINNYEMSSIINAEDVLKSINILFDYLKTTFSPKQWLRELALACEIDGQLYKGEADLVLETDEGYILIDYKSYPGSIENVLDNSDTNTVYAGKYAGQLEAYSKMIHTTTNKKVIQHYIYYTVLGKLVAVKFN
jgi:ATP-dependent exoDNAse (exonuclease V) beta subunit